MSNDEQVDARAALLRELGVLAGQRARRRAALLALRRQHAVRRANGLIDRQAARAARLRARASPPRESPRALLDERPEPM
jgi:hypothetical protein